MKRLSMGWKLAILAALNLVDMIITLRVLATGEAREFNPIMRWAYEVSPLTFGALKTLLFIGGTTILWINKDEPKAHHAARIALGIFGTLVLYQILSMAHVIRLGQIP